MDWILRCPQMLTTFGNLGYTQADGYHVNDNCKEALTNILHNLLSEDKHLLTYRRSISFGRYVQKDIIPLLIHSKDDDIIELLICILVNLTIPIECLLSLNELCKSDFGRHTIFEINNLLASLKVAFTDQRVTKVIIEFLKKNIDFEKPVENQRNHLTPEQCANTANVLSLLRNILHIPEDSSSPAIHTVQNQILWNIFSQSFDKVLIKLLNIPEASTWSVMMVQVIALLYKNQHTGTLHKLLNLWLESQAQSDSSEDNESNTSPPNAGSENSSLMLTSDPTTSDSSDTGAGGKANGNTAGESGSVWVQPLDGQSQAQPQANPNKQPVPTSPPPPLPQPSSLPPPLPPPPSLDTKNLDKRLTTELNASKRKLNESGSSGVEDNHSESSPQNKPFRQDKKNMVSETSDCGYGTQIETRESVSTSSNEDEPRPRKPVHQKPLHPKQKPNTKNRIGNNTLDKKRKKIIKRGKSAMSTKAMMAIFDDSSNNVQGLPRKVPTDDDIAIILKDFTIDFLLKGYNSLVRMLHSQILKNANLKIDTSHFFWLVTYFLKFAMQIESSLENLTSVLSFDIIAYLIAEAVNLCEQFELISKLDGTDLKPSIRRLHLVVTAIREFVQAVEGYQKLSLGGERRACVARLQSKLCESVELRALMLLLLRRYDPDTLDKQYLQDLIVTNHVILLFLDSTSNAPGYNGKTNLTDHLRQYATSEMMYPFALLLEDFAENGKFVNDCVFTIMHHVGGDLDGASALTHPKLLEIFTSISTSEFEIREDWTDLIEYVLNKFVRKPIAKHRPSSLKLVAKSCNANWEHVRAPPSSTAAVRLRDADDMDRVDSDNDSDYCEERWTESESSSLNWHFMQCSTSQDVIGDIVKLFSEDCLMKSRDSIVKELYRQNLIEKAEYDVFLKTEYDRNAVYYEQTKESRNNEIVKLCEQLIQDGKSRFLEWMQKVLLDTCCAKIYLEKKAAENVANPLKFVCLKKKHVDLPEVSPVSYHSLLMNKSVPLVPWTFEQASVCKDPKFLQIVHKLGLHMPDDSGKVFIRIPQFWTADFLYDVAGQLMPIDIKKLKFCKNDIPQSGTFSEMQNKFTLSADIMRSDVPVLSGSENYYCIHKQNQATMLNYTPMPGISFEGGAYRTAERNWLEIVQRSKELKITMQAKNDSSIKPKSCLLTGSAGIFVPPVLPLPTGLGPRGATAAAAATATATVTATATKPATLPFVSTLPARSGHCHIMTMTDDEDNSVCDTASVTSDLTRMYVSDEDDKSFMALDTTLFTCDDAVSSFSEYCSGVKRPRVTF